VSCYSRNQIRSWGGRNRQGRLSVGMDTLCREFHRTKKMDRICDTWHCNFGGIAQEWWPPRQPLIVRSEWKKIRGSLLH